MQIPVIYYLSMMDGLAWFYYCHATRKFLSEKIKTYHESNDENQKNNMNKVY